MISESKLQAYEIIKRKEKQANEKIEAARNDAINELKDEAIDIALSSTKKYLRQNLDQTSLKIIFDNNTEEIKRKI